MQFLKDKGISASINYTPNHLQPFFRNGQRLPVTEKLFSEILTLPLFADMTETEIQHVIDGVKDYLR
jgi:dTDP-4-amino-4,6-dideoxygalactose transaminase